jgi:peroxiredoxin
MRLPLAMTIAFISLTVNVALAGKYNRVLNIGQVAPDWSNIQSTDDMQHSLGDYKNAKIVVVAFTCNHCPVAASYEKRLVELQKDYVTRGVQIVAICVSRADEDNLEAMKTRANAQRFNFPYLSDPSQSIGRTYGARTTPEVFVLDGNRKLVYMGSIDDNWMPGGVVN